MRNIQRLYSLNKRPHSSSSSSSSFFFFFLVVVVVVVVVCVVVIIFKYILVTRLNLCTRCCF